MLPGLRLQPAVTTATLAQTTARAILPNRAGVVGLSVPWVGWTVVSRDIVTCQSRKCSLKTGTYMSSAALLPVRCRSQSSSCCGKSGLMLTGGQACTNSPCQSLMKPHPAGRKLRQHQPTSQTAGS